MKNLKELKESRAEIQTKVEALIAVGEKSELTAEQKTDWKNFQSQIEAIDADIVIAEQMEAEAKKIAARKIASGASALPGPTQDGDSEYKELLSLSKKFSIGRALKMVSSRKEFNGAEEEVFQIAKAEAKEQDISLSGNMHIPHSFIKMGRRSALTVGTEGADVVFTEYGGKIIPYLNPMPVADQLGVTFLNGLNGNVQWPRSTNRLTLGFETETSDVDETTPTFDNISISPKRFGGYVDYTLQMQKQSVFNVDEYIKRQLTIAHEYLIDDQLFNGSGSANQTTGILAFSGVNNLSLGTSGGDMTYAAALSMIRDTEIANARDGKRGFVTNARGKFALAVTPKQVSGVEGNFIFNVKDKSLLAEPFYLSNVIPSNLTDTSGGTNLSAMIFSSNWAGWIVGFWGGLDLTFDPFTQKLGGKNRIVVNGFMDQDCEQPAEFSISKDWNTTTPALT